MIVWGPSRPLGEDPWDVPSDSEHRTFIGRKLDRTSILAAAVLILNRRPTAVWQSAPFLALQHSGSRRAIPSRHQIIDTKKRQ